MGTTHPLEETRKGFDMSDLYEGWDYGAYHEYPGAGKYWANPEGTVVFDTVCRLNRLIHHYDMERARTQQGRPTAKPGGWTDDQWLGALSGDLTFKILGIPHISIEEDKPKEA